MIVLIQGFIQNILQHENILFIKGQKCAQILSHIKSGQYVIDHVKKTGNVYVK